MGTIREVLKKNGEKSYHAEVRLKGHRPERESFRTKTDAKKWIQDTEAAIRDGRFKSQSASRRYTVNDLIERFISKELSKDQKYFKKKVLLLNRWKKELGKMFLVDLTTTDLADVRDKLLSEATRQGEMRSSATTNRYLAAFSKVLSFGVKELDWLKENLMKKIGKPKESQGRDRFLLLEEIDRLLAACNTSSNRNLYPIVSLALITGMRYGEIVNLKWGDINFDNRFLTLHKTKNGSRRVIPLTDQMIDILKTCPSFGADLSERVFKSGKESVANNPLSIRKAFKRVLDICKIQDFHFHDLRHTAASHIAMGGATQGELMTILGHRSPAMTRRYAHYSQPHLANILEKSGSKMIKNSEKESDSNA